MKAWNVMALFLALVLTAGTALAQQTQLLYVQQGALEEGQAQRILTMLKAEFGEVQWTLAEDGQALRELVLAGRAPDLAICAPGEARPWAREGMLAALQTQISDQQRMQRQVLDLCVQGEGLFMAPLIAHHRQMVFAEPGPAGKV